MRLTERLKKRRDKIQSQLDRWIARGFRDRGSAPFDETPKEETAKKVSDVANLSRIIAEREVNDDE